MFAKEEKLDGMSEEELARQTGDSGMMGMDNNTDCNCFAFETQDACGGSPLGCIWRPLFESCHPPEMIDGGAPICPETTAPTFSPTQALELPDTTEPTVSPTHTPTATPGRKGLFRYLYIREHEDAINKVSTDDDEFEDELLDKPATAPTIEEKDKK